MNPSLLAAVAVRAASRASHHAFSHLDRCRDAKCISEVEHDVKLKLDLECQNIAVETILEAFPDHTILGEEDTPETAAAKRADAPYEWIIDPIDGTVNFFHRNPYWCCSVAVRALDSAPAGDVPPPELRGPAGAVVAAAVAAPGQGKLFEASIDGPALCNGTPIHVSSTDDMALAMVFTGADRAEAETRRPWRYFDRIAELSQRPRICGAAALDLCHVAMGAAEAYFEPGIFLWDIAASDLILRRAGGKGTAIHRFSDTKLAYLGTNARPAVTDTLVRELTALV